MNALCWLLPWALAACTPPVSSPSQQKPTLPKPPAVTATTTPAGIPQTALQFRRPLIQAWQFYFAMGQPAAIGFAQIHQESRWNPNATSPVGARGLSQFMPGTADWIDTLLPADQRCSDPAGCATDPRWAINAMTRFDWWLWEQNAGAATDMDRWGKSLAGYNGGQGWVQRESAKALNPAVWWDSVELVCLRSAAACAETRDYVRKIWNKWRPLYLTWG